jgi:hypothetical protein
MVVDPPMTTFLHLCAEYNTLQISVENSGWAIASRLVAALEAHDSDHTFRVHIYTTALRFEHGSIHSMVGTRHHLVSFSEPTNPPTCKIVIADTARMKSELKTCGRLFARNGRWSILPNEWSSAPLQLVKPDSVTEAGVVEIGGSYFSGLSYTPLASNVERTTPRQPEPVRSDSNEWTRDARHYMYTYSIPYTPTPSRKVEARIFCTFNAHLHVCVEDECHENDLVQLVQYGIEGVNGTVLVRALVANIPQNSSFK